MIATSISMFLSGFLVCMLIMDWEEWGVWFKFWMMRVIVLNLVGAFLNMLNVHLTSM